MKASDLTRNHYQTQARAILTQLSGVRFDNVRMKVAGHFLQGESHTQVCEEDSGYPVIQLASKDGLVDEDIIKLQTAVEKLVEDPSKKFHTNIQEFHWIYGHVILWSLPQQ